MVGTHEYHVTPCSRTVRQKLMGLNLPGTTTVPPVRKVESVEATRPCMWKSGITQSETSLAVSWYVLTTFAQDTARFLCFSGTRLGRPVLPLVWSTRATSSGLSGSTGAFFGAP